MLGRFCLAELDLLNKMHFTFEVVPCFRRYFKRCASILAQCYEGLVGWLGGEKTTLGEDMRSQVAGPDHTTRPKGDHSFKG